MTTQNQLQSDVIGLVQAGAVSAVAQVTTGGQIATAVAGPTVQGGSTVTVPGTHFRTGSITKTYVATVVLQLAGEGRLSLDDTVDRWLPGVITGNGNDGTKITVKQLLQHTSGLFDYTHDAGFLATISTPAEFAANNSHHYTPQDLLNIALAHPPTFASGTSWGYSNTDYIVAGLIIQSVTRNTWDVEVTNRIITRLGLSGTSIPGDTMTLPTPFAHGYNIYSGQPNRVYTDTTQDDMTWADAAGAIITTVADNSKFFISLLGGQLLQPAQLSAMKTTVPIGSGNDYGLGIAHTVMCGKDIWWHNGGTIGYYSYVATTGDTAITVAYDVTTTDITGADGVFDNNLSSAESSLVKHAFCGNMAVGGVAPVRLDKLGVR